MPPKAHEQRTTISPDTQPYSSGMKRNEISNNEEEYIPHSPKLSPVLRQKHQEMIAYARANTPNPNPILSEWTEMMVKITNPNPKLSEITDTGTSSDEERETMNEVNSYIQHKYCTSLSVPSFDFDSTNEEQEPKCSPSRNQKIINNRK